MIFVRRVAGTEADAHAAPTVADTAATAVADSGWVKDLWLEWGVHAKLLDGPRADAWKVLSGGDSRAKALAGSASASRRRHERRAKHASDPVRRADGGHGVTARRAAQ